MQTHRNLICLSKYLPNTQLIDDEANSGSQSGLFRGACYSKTSRAEFQMHFGYTTQPDTLCCQPRTKSGRRRPQNELFASVASAQERMSSTRQQGKHTEHTHRTGLNGVPHLVHSKWGRSKMPGVTVWFTRLKMQISQGGTCVDAAVINNSFGRKISPCWEISEEGRSQKIKWVLRRSRFCKNWSWTSRWIGFKKAMIQKWYSVI